MTTYLIADITVHDPEKFQEYASQAPQFIKKHQGKYLVRGGEATVGEGDWQPGRIVVLEFPSRENAEAFLQDPAYQPVAAIRHESATTKLVLVDGYTAAAE